ncbi:MAG: C-terminal binding protein [Panacagrimonas sp.]
MKKKVLLTDYAWPNLDLEHARFKAAGMQLIAGPKAAPPAAEIVRMAAEHRPQAIMTCWALVTAEAIRHCENLELVARIGVGLDNIDRHAAAASGAIVTNVPDYCMEDVSDHAIALLLSWARGVVEYDREVKTGIWDPSRARPHRVSTLTVGIAGFGRIGQLAARKLRGLGVKLLAFGRSHAPDHPADIEWVDFGGLLARSDAVIVLLPLGPETRHIFDAGAFARMKPGSLLVNVSRGALVHNEDLLAALEQGRPGMAALDVVEGEPSPPRSITGHPRVIATPHIAFSSPASVEELRLRATEEVIRVLAGEAPRNPCPPPQV